METTLDLLNGINNLTLFLAREFVDKYYWIGADWYFVGDRYPATMHTTLRVNDDFWDISEIFEIMYRDVKKEDVEEWLDKVNAHISEQVKNKTHESMPINLHAFLLSKWYKNG